MNLGRIDTIVPASTAVIGTIALAVWLGGSEVRGLQQRVPPVEEEAPPEPARPIAETGEHRATGLEPPVLPGSWPRFRNARFDNVARDTPPLARSWPPDGPPVLWSREVGEGHAGVAIRSGRVYITDFDADRRRDVIRCLSLQDGRDVWSFSYPTDVQRKYGMSRTVPAVSEKYLVSIGPMCQVVCLDTPTGQFRWAIDLVREFGTKVPSWYTGQCPLIDNGRAIIAPGGEGALMIAVDCESGEIAWQTPNPDNWKMTHSSIIPTEIGGTRMYLYPSGGGLVAVSAETGEVLWTDPTWRVTFANVPCPVPLGDGRIFLTGGYGGVGSRMIRVRKRDDEYRVETLFHLKEQEFSAEQHTPIYFGGHLYGVIVGGRLVCLHPSGRIAWATERSNRFGTGRGPYLIADGLLFLLTNTGELVLVEATGGGYTELDRARTFTAKQAFGPMAIAGSRLICRDETTLKCLDVRRK